MRKDTKAFGSLRLLALGLVIGVLASPMLFAQEAAVNDGEDSTVQIDKDVPAKTKKQIEDTLSLMKTIKGARASTYHQQVFGQTEGESYLDFLSQRVTLLKYKKANDKERKEGVLAFAESDHSVTLTSVFTKKASMPMVGRISTILHEARHCETPNGTSWPHVFCPDEDPTKDYPGCDETILGAYGVEVIFLKNLKKNCESCGDKVKRDAEIYGDAYEGQIIDASVKDAASAK